MSEEKMEMMEVTENEAVESEMDDYTDETGSGKVLGLVLAGLAGAATLGAVAYKKIKSKKEDKKPKKRKKLMWVEVEDEPAEEDDENIIDGEAKEVVDEPKNEKKKK